MDLYTYLKALKMGRSGSLFEDLVAIKRKTGSVIKTEFAAIASFITKRAQTAIAVEVQLEPIQDLHGYDKPWSGGAGKNKLPNVKSQDGSNRVRLGLSGAGYIPLKAGTYKLSYGLASGITAQPYWRIEGGTVNNNTNIVLTEDSNVLIWLYAVPLSANDVLWGQLEVGSTATSYEPYSNICPISGRTECVTQRTGKNLCARYTDRASHNGIEYTVTDEGIRVHGTATAASYSWRSIYTYDTCPIHLKAGTYKFSVTDMVGANQQEAYLVFMGKTKSGADLGNAVVLNGVTTSVTKTFTEDVGLYYGFFVKSGLTVDKVVKPQIELGSTATDYEAYDGQTYTTSLGRTVYGGQLDVVSGELGVTMGYIASYNGETIGEPWISDRDEYVAGTTPSIGAEVAYTLAEPQTYQLDAQTVALLLGANNVWSDGDISVTYVG